MTQILVAGLINDETTLRVPGFPVPYEPVRYPFFGVQTTAAGVGLNIGKALTVLGDEVTLLSLVGRDVLGELALAALQSAKIGVEGTLRTLDETAQSVILYDESGRRAISTDLKDIQQRAYPYERLEPALAGKALAVICNINFARPLLAAARRKGIPIATDVHAIADVDDEYNRDYMAAAHILFQSDERLPGSPEDWVRGLWARYETPVAVVGLGAAGALLGVRDEGVIKRFPAVKTRPVVNTVGAGDALFSCFVHFYAQDGDPYRALEKALVFASYKIGAKGAADGFLSEAELAGW